MAPEQSNLGTTVCARCRGPVGAARGGELYCDQCGQALAAAAQRVRARQAAHAPVKPIEQTPKPAAEVLPAATPLPVSDEDPSVKIVTRICLSCSHTVHADNPVCAYCGWDVRKGLPKKFREMEAAPKPTCRKCGYELTGLKTNICPECGTRNRLTARGAELDKNSREITKWAYLRPALMLCGGVGGLILFYGIRYSSEPWFMVFAVVSFAINAVVLWVVYTLCGLGWIGLDMPHHLAALRLSGILAVATLLLAVLGLVPAPVLALGIAGFAFVWMLHQEMDLEFQDAVIIAILTMGAMTVVWLLGTLKIASMMGLSI
jgi:predicted RNA-binding Zn-ribbon protein involved in translation (DUF1610 family)